MLLIAQREAQLTAFLFVAHLAPPLATLRHVWLNLLSINCFEPKTQKLSRVVGGASTICVETYI